MKTLSMVTLALLLAGPATAQLAPWWISEDGCTMGIRLDDELEYTKGCAPNSLTWVPYWGQTSGFYAEDYVIDDEGDLCLVRADWYDPAGSYDWQSAVYDPPLKILDYPLTVGKTWTAESQLGWLTITRTGTVVAHRTVETGIGDLEVLEVTMDDQTHFLHEQLGDVTYLVSLSNCNVVAEEEITWGGLKATYR